VRREAKLAHLLQVLAITRGALALAQYRGFPQISFRKLFARFPWSKAGDEGAAALFIEAPRVFRSALRLSLPD
jgi:hypothetical protein